MLVRCALTEPMWQRLKRQEGGLLVIVVSSLFFMGSPSDELLIRSILTLTTLSTLYFLNDLTDCVADQHNPRKDHLYMATLAQNRTPLWGWLCAQKAIIMALGWILVDITLAYTVLAICLINAAYSFKLKGVPYLDVVWVGLWGASIAAMAGLHQPAVSYLVIGIMTAISHIYQVRVDAPVDTAHNVKTSAVLSHRATEIQIIFLCIGLVLLLIQAGLFWLSWTACIPWLLGKFLESGRAWVLARYYFGILWLCYLESAYGRLAQL